MVRPVDLQRIEFLGRAMGDVGALVVLVLVV